MDKKYSNSQLNEENLEEVAGGKGELKKGSAALMSSLMLLSGAPGMSAYSGKTSSGSGQTISTRDSGLDNTEKSRSFKEKLKGFFTKENLKKYGIPAGVVAGGVGSAVALYEILSHMSSPKSKAMVSDSLKTAPGTTVKDRIINTIRAFSVKVDNAVFVENLKKRIPRRDLHPTLEQVLNLNADEALKKGANQLNDAIFSIMTASVEMFTRNHSKSSEASLRRLIADLDRLQKSGLLAQFTAKSKGEKKAEEKSESEVSGLIESNSVEEKHDSVESEPVEDKKSEEKSESEISAPVEEEREQEAPKLDIPQAEDNQVSRAISEFQNVVKRFKVNSSVSLKDLISYNIKTILPGLKLTNKEVRGAIEKHDLGQYFEYTMRMLNDKNHAKERSQLNENLEKIFNHLIEQNENKKLELERLAQIEAQRAQEKAEAQAPVEEQKAEEKSENEVSAPIENNSVEERQAEGKHESEISAPVEDQKVEEKHENEVSAPIENNSVEERQAEGKHESEVSAPVEDQKEEEKHESEVSAPTENNSVEEKHDSVESEPVEDKKSEEKSESEISAPVEEEREQEAPKLDIPQAEDNQVSRAISEFQNVVKRFKVNSSVSLKDLISYNIKTILPGLKLTNKEVRGAIEKHDLGQYFEYTMRMLNDKNHAKKRSQLNENLEKIFNYLIEQNEKK